MPVLLDSDVIIEVLRGREPGIASSWRTLAGSQDVVCCSPVNLAEVWQGARPAEEESIEAFFAAIRCVDITSAIGSRAGLYLKRYGKSHSLELGDALIAATASVSGLSLWTRNRKHYPMPDVQFFE